MRSRSRCPTKSADFAVVLMGNNEVVGPYGPGTFNQNLPGEHPGWSVRIQALKRTRIVASPRAGVILKIRPTDAMQDLEWEGMQMFTNNGVRHDDPRMESVYGHYEDNLTNIIETLHDKGIHVVLSSVPVNLRHSAPFLSVHSPDLPGDQLEQWQELTRAGAQSTDDENWNDAIAQYQAALAIDAEYADTHFRLATALENVGDAENAETHYRRALDLDALRFRTDTRLNQIIQDVAASADSDTFSFVDSAAAFEQASQPYQPGWNLLLEHVHYGFAGNNVLAAAITRSIMSSVSPADDYQPLPVAEVARRVGFPNYDSIEEIKNLQGMILQPPFPGQSNYADLKRFLDEEVERLTNEVGSQREVVQRRQSVVEANLVDWKVHFELAVLYQRLRNPPAMYYHLNRIIELYPHNRETYMKIAEAMSMEGRWREVIPYLERSLYYTRGDDEKAAESINWLGTAHLRTGDYEKAKDLLLLMPNKYPDQIALTLRAYGNLIKYSRDNGIDKDVDRYVKDVQRYARSLIRQGKDKEFALLNQRMSQLMALAGYTAEAEEWAEAARQ